MKQILYGDGGTDDLNSLCQSNNVRKLIIPSFRLSKESEPQPEMVAQLAQEVYASDLLPLLIQFLPRLEFEVNNPLSLSPSFVIF